MAKSPEVGSSSSDVIYRLIFCFASTDIMIISAFPLREAMRTVTISSLSEPFYDGMSIIAAGVFGLVAAGGLTQALASRNRN